MFDYFSRHADALRCHAMLIFAIRFDARAFIFIFARDADFFFYFFFSLIMLFLLHTLPRLLSLMPMMLMLFTLLLRYFAACLMLFFVTLPLYRVTLRSFRHFDVAATIRHAAPRACQVASPVQRAACRNTPVMRRAQRHSARTRCHACAGRCARACACARAMRERHPRVLRQRAWRRCAARDMRQPRTAQQALRAYAIAAVFRYATPFAATCQLQQRHAAIAAAVPVII